MAITYKIYAWTKGDYVIFDVDGAEYRISGQLLAMLNRDFPEKPSHHDEVRVLRELPGRGDDVTTGNISTDGNERPDLEAEGSYRFSVAYGGGRRETLGLPSYVVHALVYASRQSSI